MLEQTLGCVRHQEGLECSYLKNQARTPTHNALPNDTAELHMQWPFWKHPDVIQRDACEFALEADAMHQKLSFDQTACHVPHSKGSEAPLMHQICERRWLLKEPKHGPRARDEHRNLH